MNYKGRAIDAMSVWERFVDFPNERIDEADVFSPKVVCPNPAHDTLKRHFQVNLTEPLVHCFAHCGISGTWEHAICIIEGLYDKFKVEDADNERERKRRRERAWREARKIILRSASPAKRGERILRRGKLDENSRRAVSVVSTDELSYESYLPQAAGNYLKERGISSAAISEWELGWLPQEKRIAIPAKDLNGRLRFLIKRGITAKQNPKYLYTEGFPKTSLLFGACQIDLGMVRSEGLIVVEGSLDTINFHQHGLRNTGGILGTGISDAQVRIIEKLRPRRIVMAFDKDVAGIKNIEIAAGALYKYPLYVMKYPKGKSDPGELTKEEAYRQVERAVPFWKFSNTYGLSVRRRRRKEFVG